MHITTAVRLAAVLSVAALLPGCNNTAPQTAAAEAPVDNSGIAKSCVASPVDPAAGPNASATITMSNDGWCAVRVAEKDRQPFATGLVRGRPEHGRIVIEKSGNLTLLQYFPTPGFSGTDNFTAALRSRTQGAADLMIKVAVTVARPS